MMAYHVAYKLTRCGTYSTAEAIKAGLDLEMPGPTVLRGRLVNHALLCGKLHEDDIDACVRRILHFINRVIPLGIPSNAPERTVDTKETAAQLRDISSSSIVLLRNENQVLPFSKEKSVCLSSKLYFTSTFLISIDCRYWTQCQDSNILRRWKR